MTFDNEDWWHLITFCSNPPLILYLRRKSVRKQSEVKRREKSNAVEIRALFRESQMTRVVRRSLLLDAKLKDPSAFPGGLKCRSRGTRQKIFRKAREKSVRPVRPVRSVDGAILTLLEAILNLAVHQNKFQ